VPKYQLKFQSAARKEWDKLDGSVQIQFLKALKRRLEGPRVPRALLAGMPDCYKIKLRELGYRLVYRVYDNEIMILVLAVGKRERNLVYDIAERRFNEIDDTLARPAS
jgi:mRNA interferase RelE/StbE